MRTQCQSLTLGITLLLSGCGSVSLNQDAGEPGPDAAVLDAAIPDTALPDAGAPPDASLRVVTAELAQDTERDDLPDDWNFTVLQPVLAFGGSSRWMFTCSGGGAQAGTWTIDMSKSDADDCINRMVIGPAMDYPVRQIAGSAPLTAPYLQCGSAKQLSLRAQEGEMFTLYPPHTGSYEGQWCNNVISSGINPPSSHQLSVSEL